MITRKKEQVFFWMIAPSFIGFVIFFILPAIMSLGYSFTNWSVYKVDFNFIGIKNYLKLFNDAGTMAAVGNSLRYAVIITIIQNTLAIAFSVFLSKKGLMVNLVKTVLFLPAVLSILVVGYLWSYMMTSSDSGLLNSILHTFGMGSVNWLGNANIALYSVLATQVWQWTGWSLVIYIANLKSIDGALYEAANIDGASGRQVFLNITLPLLYPAVSFNVLMSLIGGFKIFDSIFAMTGGGPGYATETIMTTLIRIGFTEGRNAYSCAFAMIFFVIVFVITKIIQFLFSKWEGSVL